MPKSDSDSLEENVSGVSSSEDESDFDAESDEDTGTKMEKKPEKTDATKSLCMNHYNSTSKYFVY